MRGNTWRAPLPNTGTTRKFSVRYWIKTMPRDSGSGRGGSTMSFAGASFSIAINGEGPRTSLALCANTADAHSVTAVRTALMNMWLTTFLRDLVYWRAARPYLRRLTERSRHGTRTAKARNPTERRERAAGRVRHCCRKSRLPDTSDLRVYCVSE